MTTFRIKRLVARLFFFATLTLTAGAGLAQSVTLKFIQTTDVHGTVYPYDFINDQPLPGSLAQVQTFVQQQRKLPKQEVILLSGGDILQGQPTVYYYNFERPDTPHLYARVMNYMGYAAGAVGNHDIETGHAVYDAFRDQIDFPWLAANAVRTDGNGPYFPPYTVLSRQGIKIAVLGMVTPGIPNWLPPKIWQGMTFADMIEAAQKWAPIIREREQPDLLVGLFHSGADFTFGGATADQPKNENASRLVAEQVPGFDIVFVGHDHHGWNFTATNRDSQAVLVLGASAYARDAAVATVNMTFDSSAGHWAKAISGEIVSMQDFQPDSAFIRTFAPEFEAVKQYVARPIGKFTRSISTRAALFGDAAFVDLVHQIQLRLTGADFSISAPLSFDAGINSGPVYVRDMFKLYKYENLLYCMHLSGKEVHDFLEYSAAGWFNQMSGPGDHLLKFKTDEAGAIVHSKKGAPQLATPLFSFDSVAGLDYEVDVSQPAGKRVRILGLTDGRRFDPDAMYKVAVNSYRGNGGGGHLTKGAGIAADSLAMRILASTEKDLRYFLMKWIEKTGVVNPAPIGNWRVIPQEWWQAGKELDFELLYGEGQPASSY